MGSSAVAARSAPAASSDSFSILTTVGAAVLAGLGMLGTFYWLLLLPFHWLYFLSFVPLILGAYLLFTRATGPDHA